jgi:hypothetical protein
MHRAAGIGSSRTRGVSRTRRCARPAGKSWRPLMVKMRYPMVRGLPGCGRCFRGDGQLRGEGGETRGLEKLSAVHGLASSAKSTTIGTR